MDRQRYRNAFDRLEFSADFQQRTQELLRQRALETESAKEHTMMKRAFFRKPAAIIAAAALLAGAASAAALWLSPAQVARHAGAPLLAEAFESKDAVSVNQSVETGDYEMTLLGLVSGAELSDWDQDADASHTYAVAALRRLDGQPLTNENFDFMEFTLTPLVSGYSPQAVNNWTLESFATGFVQDGLYYYLLDTQDLNIFAHRTVYLAFFQGGSPSNSVFRVEQDGQIAFREDFEGPKALFTLPLDPAKGDPAAADAFVESTGMNHWANLEDCPEEELDPSDAVTFTPSEETKD